VIEIIQRKSEGKVRVEGEKGKVGKTGDER
jgi:hypothetical protein